MNQQPIEEMSPSETAQAVVQTKKGISIVWVVPLVAILLGGFLAYKAITEKGPTITITFESAEGLEAGKTKIKYKDVEVGQVQSIRLRDDLGQVIVTADMVKGSKHHLNENTRFWVVRARIAAGKVSDLGTLFSGAYIGLDPGKSGKAVRSFKGLEKTPIITTDLPGRHFMLKAESLGSLDVGSPINYRQTKVGQIIAYELEKNGQAFDIKIFIHAPYDEYVRKYTRFYNASGLDVSLDASGIKINTDSFVSMMIGGIAFENPKDPGPSPAAMEGDTFRLFERREDIYKKSYVKKFHWLLHFNDSVRGLTVGAPVELKGINVGKVVDIKLELDFDSMDFRIPVLIEIEPERIATTGNQTFDRQLGTEMLVEKGLRARLKPGSLLTGQLYVDLDIYPDDSPRKVVYGGKYPAIPTIPTPIREITRDITQIVDKLEKLPLEQLSNKLRDTMEQSQTTLVKLDRFLDAESPTGHELKRVLTELADAARNISVLADYLERHPESLVFGKDKRNEK
jgi:paraquat-inducible protein B